MSQYRKKPVVIEAVQFTVANGPTVADWCGGQFWNGATRDDVGNLKKWITIDTLEGEMTAQIGDFIIKGVQGEFYPYKPDIFEQTYEEVQ